MLLNKDRLIKKKFILSLFSASARVLHIRLPVEEYCFSVAAQIIRGSNSLNVTIINSKIEKGSYPLSILNLKQKTLRNTVNYIYSISFCIILAHIMLAVVPCRLLSDITYRRNLIKFNTLK